MAESGLKTLLPVGRPFIDYVLGGLADAGFRRVCIVIGTRHDLLRTHCEKLPCQRLSIEYVTHQEPKGTANALLAAESCAGQDSLLLINSDNYYPTTVLRTLRKTQPPATAGFDRNALAELSNISSGRIAKYAIMTVNADGYLVDIVEKPTDSVSLAHAQSRWVSMNCWSFTPAIFEAARQIPRSPRGEFELPDAVIASMREFGQAYRVVEAFEPVLDLSHRKDIDSVARHLRDVEVKL